VQCGYGTDTRKSLISTSAVMWMSNIVWFTRLIHLINNFILLVCLTLTIGERAPLPHMHTPHACTHN